MKTHSTFSIVWVAAALVMLGDSSCHAELRAGAAVVDVTPLKLPVLVNGSMVSRTADQVKTPVNARAIALDDGNERIAIIIVDSCMMPRPLLDEAKKLAADRVGIPADHILIGATHTHSAPSSMACLGTNADPEYVPYLRGKLVEAVEAAAANLEPARVGWASIDASEYTALRRWIRRPDRIAEDPFGNPTVRANMHAGRNWDDVVGESGPEDPELSLISLQSLDGRPIAVLANFSMHYFSDQALSADYFGLFSEGLKRQLIPETIDGVPPFVGMMSHGCSGDIWRRDYTQPIPSADEDFTISTYADGLIALAVEAYEGIEYDSDADLAMAESRFQLDYRVPDKQRLEWAQRIADEIGDRLPETSTEVYALEQIILHERQSTEVVIQALRIGDMAIATTPTETYALTGLKIKAASPLQQTMVLDLTNGGDGYIPPPEQHRLGGYNTWPARSAGLEIQAEPKMTETAIQLLEQVTGRPRNDVRQSMGPGAEAVLALEPVAYWRMDETAAPWATDSSGRNREAIYEDGVVYYLAGPRSDLFCADGEVNRAPHFAGERMVASAAGLGEQYSLSMWIWNGMPVDAREVTGWFLSRGRDLVLDDYGDHLGIGGTNGHSGRLVFLHGSDENSEKLVAGDTQIERWTWYHVVYVRDGESVRIYLNGTPEMELTAPAERLSILPRLFLGGRCDNQFNWEGRMDEVSLFDRPLSAEEIARLTAD